MAGRCSAAESFHAEECQGATEASTTYGLLRKTTEHLARASPGASLSSKPRGVRRLLVVKLIGKT